MCITLYKSTYYASSAVILRLVIFVLFVESIDDMLIRMLLYSFIIFLRMVLYKDRQLHCICLVMVRIKLATETFMHELSVLNFTYMSVDFVVDILRIEIVYHVTFVRATAIFYIVIPKNFVCFLAYIIIQTYCFWQVDMTRLEEVSSLT